MSTVDYGVGGLACLIVVAALVSTAASLRRLLLPDWRGAEARLAELVLGTSTAVALHQLLGLVSLLRRPAVVIAAVVLALATGVLSRRRAAPQRKDPLGDEEAAGPPRWQWALAGVAVAAVLAQWVLSVRQLLAEGNQRVDAVHYHLTYAAHFAQDHSILPTYRLDNFGVSTWYPLNNELLQGAGIVLLGTAALTLVLDFLALAAVLVSALVLAKPYRAQPAAVIAACLLLAVVGPRYAGASFNDWASVWPLLAGFALLMAARERNRELPPSVLLLVGLAGGLAVGTKLTVAAPAVVLLVVLVALQPVRRWRAAGIVLGGHVVTGGYWFLRNLLIVGNPVPATGVGVGPVQLPKPETPVLDQYDFSVLHYVTDTEVIRQWFVRGLELSFGPLWPVTLVLIAAGLVLGITWLRANRALLGLALAGFVSIAVYLATPTSAGGPEGQPFLFVHNIRYALFGYAAGLVLLVLGLARTRAASVLPAALFVLLVAMLSRQQAWAMGWWKQALLLVVLLSAVAALVATVRRLDRSLLLPAALVVGVAAAVVSVPVQQRLDRNSYTNTDNPRNALYAAIRAETGQRVGVVGAPFQFPLFGPRLQNEVVGYIGKEGDEHAFTDFDDCSAFMSELRSMRLTRVVVQPEQGLERPAAEAWLKQDPEARVLVATAAGTVFAVTPAVGPQACA